MWNDLIRDLSQNKFPLDFYIKEKWSVEHINPQNPKDFKDVYSLIKWLRSYGNSLKDNPVEKELYDDIESFLFQLQEVKDKTRSITHLRLGSEQNQKLKHIEERITNLLELHKIGNLLYWTETQTANWEIKFY